MTVPIMANMTGDPFFPHNGDVTTDVTIAGVTTWTESDYKGRVVKLDVLTVDDVLTLQGGPWWIFVESLVFGSSGSIVGDGPDGTGTDNLSADYALGGFRSQTGTAHGGCGGVMIFICANAITGTASANISANGGDGFRNTSNAGAINGAGGQGAFSRKRTVFGTAVVAERWSGDTLVTGPFPLQMLLGDGGSTGDGGEGGGSGGASASGAAAGGGSGIGGGGAADNASAGQLPIIDEPSVLHLLELALAGCLGGGGGAARVHTTGTNNSAGGGGGGSIVLWVRTNTSAPTLVAAGGTLIGDGGNGAAGVTYTVSVP